MLFSGLLSSKHSSVKGGSSIFHEDWICESASPLDFQLLPLLTFAYLCLPLLTFAYLLPTLSLLTVPYLTLPYALPYLTLLRSTLFKIEWRSGVYIPVPHAC
jgi:hypothetical protein